MENRPRRLNSIDGFSSNLNRNIEKPLKTTQSNESSDLNNVKPSYPNNNYSNQNQRQMPTANGPSLINRSIPARSVNNYNRSNTGQLPGLKQRKKWSRKRKAVTTVLTILIIIFGFLGWYGARIINSLDKVFHGNLFSDIGGVFSNTTLRGENQGRVNILLAGYQGKNSDEGPLTDSIMVVSIDTKNNTAFTMSIPRDIWLNMPGIGYQKINAANTLTSFNQPGYFKGGMGELQKVIETNFGIPIDYYALIDYTAFEDAVNAVGGITVNIQSPDPRGLYDPNVNKAHGGPLRLPNGPVHLDGLQALALALARGDSPYAYGFPLSDINRTQHQRQMLIALEQKAMSAGVLSNPLDVTHLFDALGNNVRTDLSLPDALKLAQIAHKFNVNNIQSYGLSYSGSNPLLTTYVTSNGLDALIPKAGLNNFSQIQHYYLQITSNNPVVQENASVSILNASNVNGLARNEANILTSKGFNVVYVGNTSTEYNNSMIIDNSNDKKPSSSKYLSQLFQVNPVTSTSGSVEAAEAQGYTSNFVVIIGQNWALKH
jgi:LCP family protein required for cell wall assembly